MKIPDGAKKIGNYILGIFIIIQARLLALELLGKSM
jgi:hypothetical protein